MEAICVGNELRGGNCTVIPENGKRYAEAMGKFPGMINRVDMDIQKLLEILKQVCYVNLYHLIQPK